MYYIFDTHAHYDDGAFDEDRDIVLSGLKGKGIGNVVDVSSSLQSCESVLEIASKYPFIYAAVGVIPSETGELETMENASDMNWLKELASHEKVVAVGEIGLDYHYDTPGRDIQKKWFIDQLHFSIDADLPVIIHSRDAAKDTLDIIRSEHNCATGGVMHCFSYEKEIARDYLNMGYYLGIGGVLTFKNARKLIEVVEYAPIDRLVLETDCPYLAPVPHRGERNDSGNLPYVVEKLAEIKGIDPEEVIRITTENAKNLYRLPHVYGETDG